MPAPEPGDGGPGQSWTELGRRGSRAALQLAVRSVLLRTTTLAGTVLLARLLSPADFGVFAMVAFVVSLWSALGDFGLGAALVQQDAEPTRAELRTAWTAQQLVAVVAFASVWISAPLLVSLLPELPGDAAWMLRVLAIGLPLSSLRTLPVVMMERDLRFGPLATAEVLQSATYYCAAIGLAIGGAGAWAFVVAGVLQLAVATITVNLAWRKFPGVGIDRSCLRRLLGFGFDFQASVLFVSLRDVSLPAIAGAIGGAAAAGYIGFATRVAFTIASLEEIVGRIAFPAFSRLQDRPAEQTRALNGAIMLTAMAVAPIQCWIAAVAPMLVPLVFGERWRPAVLPIQIICLAMVLRFPTRYIRHAVFAGGRSRLGLGLAVTESSLALASFTAGFLVAGLGGGAVGFAGGALAGLVATSTLARTTIRPSWYPFAALVGAIAIGTAAGLAASLAGEGLVAWLLGDEEPARAIMSSILATAAFAAVAVPLVWLTSRQTVRLGLSLAARSVGRNRG
jgi:O-antigen/teichoic acid export membrane protein